MSDPVANLEAVSAPRTDRLARWCNRLEHASLPSDYQLLDAAGLHAGHPWAFLADIARTEPGSVAYYRYLYGIVRLLDPARILEVGTAFGMSAATFLQAAPRLRSLVSLDLGVFSTEYEMVAQNPDTGWSTLDQFKTRELPADGRNIAFARDILKSVAEKLGSPAQISLHQVNTQPAGSDNFDAVVTVPRWRDVPALVAELEREPIDLLFIDGKHTGDGLYQDFKSFFPFVRPGGLVICDDLHDASYPYAWAGETVACFERILEEFASEIEDSRVWPFPQLPDNPGEEPIARPFGLIRKAGGAGAPKLAAEYRLVLDELGATGARGETAPLLAFLNQHAPLLAEVAASLGDQAVRRLTIIQENPHLFAELAQTGLPDEVAARRLGFLNHHLELFAEIEVRGLAESTAERLRFLVNRARMFEELEALGLLDKAPEALRFLRDFPVLFLQDHSALLEELLGLGLSEHTLRTLKIFRAHPALFSWGNEALYDELEALGLTASWAPGLRFLREFPHLERIAAYLRAFPDLDANTPLLAFAWNHPHLVDYLRSRPALAADLDRFQRDNHSAVPNMALMGHLVRRVMPGLRRG